MKHTQPCSAFQDILKLYVTTEALNLVPQNSLEGLSRKIVSPTLEKTWMDSGVPFVNAAVLALSCNPAWPHAPYVPEDVLKLIPPAYSCAEILGSRQASYLLNDMSAWSPILYKEFPDGADADPTPSSAGFLVSLLQNNGLPFYWHLGIERV